MSIQKKNRNRGKAYERVIAKIFKGRRVGILGKYDVEDKEGKFAIECKSVKDYPKWFENKINQTITNCPENKIPLLVIHKLNKRYKDDWVVIKMENFLEIIKGS